MHTSIRMGDVSFGAAVAFLFGVFAANSGWNLYALSVAAIFSVIAVATFSRSRAFWKYTVLILFAIVAGALYYCAYVHWQAAYARMPSGKDTAFFGVIAEEPKPAGNFTMLVVTLLRPYVGTVDIFTTPNNSGFHYGDEVWIKGSVMTGSTDDASEPPALFMPQLRVVAEHEGFLLKEVAIDIKAVISQKLTAILPPDQAALAAGIMLGTAGTMSAVLKAQMEASGTTYIVNMYGYKIAIITAALMAALKDHLPRRALSLITIAVVVLFVVVSGGSISAIRAAIMGSFAIVARGVGRVFSARNAVTFAALGMVLLNATLLTDAAFQLAFLSFLGIYYLGPAIDQYFHWTGAAAGGVLQWKEHAMLSLATNLAILPIVINTFGSFSLTSFISNILIMIPWVAVIAFGAITVFVECIAPALAFIVAQVVSALLRYELFIIHVFAAIVVPMPAVFSSTFVVIFYYSVLIIFIYYYAAPPQKDH